jgi:hypothetical protein
MHKQQPVRHFRNDPVTPVWRRWMCVANGCSGEMKSTGRGYATLGTVWEHCCDRCSRTEGADFTYPRIAWLPLEAIEPANVDEQSQNMERHK